MKQVFSCPSPCPSCQNRCEITATMHTQTQTDTQPVGSYFIAVSIDLTTEDIKMLLSQYGSNCLVLTKKMPTARDFLR